LPHCGLAEAVLAEGEHALHDGNLLDVIRRSLLDDQALDLLADDHRLVNRESSPVAGAPTRGAADGTVQRRPLPCFEILGRPPDADQLGLGRLVRIAATVAEPAGEALGNDAVECAGDEERLDAHLDETQRRGRGVVGVQGREHEVTGERRLDRRHCERSSDPYQPTEAELVGVGWPTQDLEAGEWPTLHRAVGCTSCGRTGYRGRFAIHEAMIVSEEIERLIIEQRATDDIQKVAVMQGMLTLREDGLRKAAMGQTSLEEIFRVVA
jgi:hypothetical protein